MCRGYQPCIGLVTTARGGSRVGRPRLRRTRVGVEPTTTVAHVHARPCQVPRPRGVIGSLRISHGVHCLHSVGCSVVSGRQACVLSFAHLDGASRNRTTVSRPLPDSTSSQHRIALTVVRAPRRGEQESNLRLLVCDQMECAEGTPRLAPTAVNSRVERSVLSYRPARMEGPGVTRASGVFARRTRQRQQGMAASAGGMTMAMGRPRCARLRPERPGIRLRPRGRLRHRSPPPGLLGRYCRRVVRTAA